MIVFSNLIGPGSTQPFTNDRRVASIHSTPDTAWTSGLRSKRGPTECRFRHLQTQACQRFGRCDLRMDPPKYRFECDRAELPAPEEARATRHSSTSRPGLRDHGREFASGSSNGLSPALPGQTVGLLCISSVKRPAMIVASVETILFYISRTKTYIRVSEISQLRC